MSSTATPVRIRDLRPEDRETVAGIDALHTGGSKPDYWDRVFAEFLAGGADGDRVGVAAEQEGGRLLAYLLGEIRAFEFGSDACGWIFAVGVDPEHARSGVASALLAEACRRFRQLGVQQVRTMVRRNDVPVMAFFRSNGFEGGSFVQLELDLEEGP